MSGHDFDDDFDPKELEDRLIESRRRWREIEEKWRKERAAYSSVVLRARAAFLTAVPERASDVIGELQDVLQVDVEFFRRWAGLDYLVGRKYMKRYSAVLDSAFEKWLEKHDLMGSRDDWVPRVAFQTLSAWSEKGMSGRFEYWHDALDPETSLDAELARREGRRDDFLSMDFSAQWRPDIESKRDFLNRARIEFEQILSYHAQIVESFEGVKALDPQVPGDREVHTKKRVSGPTYKPRRSKLKQQAEWAAERHFLSKTFNQMAMDAAASEQIDPDNVRKRVRDFVVLIGLIEPDKK